MCAHDDQVDAVRFELSPPCHGLGGQRDLDRDVNPSSAASIRHRAEPPARFFRQLHARVRLID
jgi:hypothetical protein